MRRGSKDILSAHIGPNRAQNLSSELTFPPEQQLKKEPDKRRKG